MKTLYTIISELAAEPSTKKKTEILNSYKDNALLKEAFFMTLDPFTNYFITADVSMSSGFGQLTLDLLKDVKEKLAGRQVTGHAARDYLESVMSGLTNQEQTILKRIINHDMECKVAGGLVNRVWPGLVAEFPVMLSEKYDEKTAENIKEGKDAIIVQLKADGGRVEIVVDERGIVTCYSRNGNILLTHGVFDAMFSRYPGRVFDGELLVIDDMGVNDRKTGNGIFNKAVRGTISAAEAAKFHVMLWDVIPLNDWRAGFCSVPYKNRLTALIEYQSTMNPGKTSVIESKVVSTWAEVQKFYDLKIAEKQEGAMVKSVDMIWENKRSKHCLKLKEVKDATLRCVGVLPHSKHPDQIGSLECMTECGKLEVSIGSGLTEEDRKRDPSYFIGNLIDMQYNSLIKRRDSSMVSMFLPRYVNLRLDQNQADTLEKLQ